MAKFTKMAIMMCFMQLLEEKQIDKITVKDICESCEINRNTFDNTIDAMIQSCKNENQTY